ncbi:MAG: N-acetylmuramoyl-L-alanine amidase [Anaerolineae bacterium]|nr:N-acetylmuramoyl-L-alanine amidase [Anaerolineae bacterium]
MSPMKPMSRREALVWIAGLSSGAAAGVCGLGALVASLFARRHPLAAVATPTPESLSITPTLTPPVILPRSAWGARDVDHTASGEPGFYGPDNLLGWRVYAGDLAEVYSTVAIHHSFPFRRDTGTMRQIQDLHMDGQRWADIGYHYGIGGDGAIYAGRDIAVRGASVAGYNTGTIGVVVIGDFEQERPADAQLDSLRMLVAWLARAYTLSHLAGHFEFNPETQCPGANLKPYLDPLAATVGLQRGTGGYATPTPAPSPTVTISAARDGGAVKTLCC